MDLTLENMILDIGIYIKKQNLYIKVTCKLLGLNEI